MPKIYKSHPAYGAHVVEPPSGAICPGWGPAEVTVKPAAAAA